MRIHGYCEDCRKIKRVAVNSAGMVRLAMNQPVFGQCDDCRDRQLERAKDRHPAYRNRP
jgi:hypothetical protein